MKKLPLKYNGKTFSIGATPSAVLMLEETRKPTNVFIRERTIDESMLEEP